MTVKSQYSQQCITLFATADHYHTTAAKLRLQSSYFMIASQFILSAQLYCRLCHCDTGLLEYITTIYAAA